jgi:C1A family cysteine protease
VKQYHTLGASKAGRVYGTKPTPTGHPFLAALARTTPCTPKLDGPLPDSVDLRQYALAPRDQGQEGCCTGFAMAAFREILWTLKTGSMIAGYLSPAYLYQSARTIEGTFPQDSGATTGDEATGIATKGVCPESFMPYSGDPSEAANPACDVAAQTFKVGNFQTVDFSNADGMKAILAVKQPIVFAFEVYQSFENPGANGLLTMPDPSESMLGGHGVLCVGYNSLGWIVRNSWGTSWADGGYCYMPYGYEQLCWMEAMTAPIQ